ncbi:hypothetical protein JCM15415_09500 [Methanobacterium movens]
MGKYLINRFGISIIIAVLISLLITLILKFFIGIYALLLLPVLSSSLSVFFANEIEYPVGMIIGLISALISLLWISPIFIFLGFLGGFLGVFLNRYLLQQEIGSSYDLNKRKSIAYPRINPVLVWINNPYRNKIVPVIGTLLLALLLIWGIFAVPMDTAQTDVSDEKAAPSKNTTSQISEDEKLEKDVKQGLSDFFKDFNTLFNYDGVKTGYILNSMKIDRLNKVSNNEVNVTVSLTFVDSSRDEFDSIWTGPFYLENGKWVDKGNFIQIHLYNVNTGEKFI